MEYYGLIDDLQMTLSMELDLYVEDIEERRVHGVYEVTFMVDDRRGGAGPSTDEINEVLREVIYDADVEVLDYQPVVRYDVMSSRITHVSVDLP